MVRDSLESQRDPARKRTDSTDVSYSNLIRISANSHAQPSVKRDFIDADLASDLDATIDVLLSSL